MKYALLVAVLVSSFSMSAEAKKRHTASSPAVSRKEARKTCLSENPELKGKSLKACIKEKRK